MAKGQTKRNGRTRGREQASASSKAKRETIFGSSQSAVQRGEQRPGQRIEPRESEPTGAVANLRPSLEGGVEQAKHAVREGAGKVSDLARKAQAGALNASHSVLDVARRNPVPAALAGAGAICTGVGVTWLLTGGRRGAPTNGSTAPSVDGSPTPAKVVERTGKEARQLAKRTQSSIGEAAHQAAHRVGQAARDARAEGQLIGEMAEKKFRAHPLAVGATIMAVGTAIGVALPSTVREGRWLGRRRDALVGRARQAALGAAHRVESIAKSPAVQSQ